MVAHTVYARNRTIETKIPKILRSLFGNNGTRGTFGGFVPVGRSLALARLYLPSDEIGQMGQSLAKRLKKYVVCVRSVSYERYQSYPSASAILLDELARILYEMVL